MKIFFTQFFTVLLVSFSTVALAHEGSIKGIVKDGKTNRGLNNTGIFIKELKQSATSDDFGVFFLKGIAAGKYTVLINHIGYGQYTESIVVEDGITTEMNVYLKPESIEMREVTVNAQKRSATSSVSGLDLKLRPVNTSQDLLRLVPGLFISQHQGGGKAEQLFLRGFDIDHGTDVNVSVDGMPVNMVSHAHGQSYADLHFVIPELVESMDFGKGPYEIDKGNLATAGWVGFKTKNYLDNNFVKMEGGLYGYYRAVAGIDLLGKAGAARNEGMYVAGEFAYNRGYFDRPQDFNRMNITTKYTKQFGSKTLLTIQATGFRSRWDASGQIPERAVAQGLIGRFGQIADEDGQTSRYNLNIGFTRAINRNTTFKSNLYVGYYDFQLYSNFTFYLNDTVNGDQIRQKESRVFAGYNADYVHNWKLGNLNTATRVGTGFRNDMTDNSELSHTLNRTTTLERLAYGDINETNIFGYISQSLDITPQLILTAGTRFDFFNHHYIDKTISEPTSNQASVHAFSPKASLYYNFKNNGRVYLSYGTGFHSNDTRVVVPQTAQKILPLAQSIDLGTVFKPVPRMLLSAAVFVLGLQQEFVYVGDEAVIEPSGRSRRIGADLSARYQLTNWLYADVDLNYTHARSIDEPAGADYIPLAPQYTTIGGLTIKPVKSDFAASLRYRHMGDRAANEDNSVVAKGYTVFDATLSYSRPSYEFGIQIQNLTNTEWNEAQFDTETRLRNEPAPVSEIHFTPGTPFFIKFTAAYKF